LPFTEGVDPRPGQEAHAGQHAVHRRALQAEDAHGKDYARVPDQAGEE